MKMIDIGYVDTLNTDVALDVSTAVTLIDCYPR